MKRIRFSSRNRGFGKISHIGHMIIFACILQSCEPSVEVIDVKNTTPCQGDPCFYPQLAPQKISKWMGARWGYTRNGGKKKHKGLDLWMPYGSKLYAMYDSYVYEVGEGSGWGNYIRCLTSVNGDQIIVMYAHIKKATVIEGAIVHAGDVIAISGETGNLSEAVEQGYTDAHMHMEVRRFERHKKFLKMEDLNPEDYMSTKLSYTGRPKIKRPCHEY